MLRWNCFFPLLIIDVGIETVDADAQTVLPSLGAPRWQTLRKLTLPSSMPVVLAGLKTAMSLALVGGHRRGVRWRLGGYGCSHQDVLFQLNVADAFAVIIALALLGLGLYGSSS